MRFAPPMAAALALLLATAPIGHAEGTATISVSGEGVVNAAPDLATINLGVTTQDASAADAMAANNAALAAVIERLSAAGIAPRDLQAANLSLNPNWVQNDGTAPPQINGYTASNTLNVRVRDLEVLGAVLDAAIKDGANTLNGISFEQSNPRPAQDEARAMAVKDARARAELMVAAAGASLGKIVSISEGGGYVNPAPMMKADMAAESVPVAAGEIGISASVNVVFEIAQ